MAAARIVRLQEGAVHKAFGDSVVHEPAVLAAHGVLLLDHAHQVTFQQGDIQVLSSVEVPLDMEELFRWVPRQQGAPQLF